MNDQLWSMVVGAGVVVALRLLDWAFPKGYIWRKVKKWSVPMNDKKDDDTR